MMLSEPTLAELILNGAQAAWRWAASGFTVVDNHTLSLRRMTCEACEHWTGLTCRKCGCTRLKVWLATEKCPAGKWNAKTLNGA